MLLEACLYRDLLQRTVITPRIHQKLITAQDQFAIDTTAHNINELNALSGRYGNPGMILALQVSMSTKPEALISLDRKMRAQREEFLREESDLDIPSVKLIPLFEEIDMVQAIPRYLGKVWEYALQSRRISQETRDRFSEMVSEVFIAGSDLSQQVSQAAGAALFAQAKRDIAHWLAEHGLCGCRPSETGKRRTDAAAGRILCRVLGQSRPSCHRRILRGALPPISASRRGEAPNMPRRP